MTKSLRTHLEAVFEADRSLRKAEARLLGSNNKELRALLARAVAEAQKLEDQEEACLRLERLADLCAQAPGAETLDALIEMLDHGDASVHVGACEALVDAGCEHPQPFAAAVKRALKRPGAAYALEQLPWIIAEIGEPDAEELIKPFLRLENGQAAGAAVEALISLGTPEALAAIEPLKDDPRPVELDEDEDETCEHCRNMTIGQLVRSFLHAVRSS
jgi:HEAT repeat protein